jgi:hypothetical protein
VNSRSRLLWLGAYALAMALVEAAIVIHLRHLYYPVDPRALFPLEVFSPADLVLELARELATAVMILAVAVLAERGFPRRFAAFVFVFGLWDLGYYAWLKAFLDWPRHWQEWDVLYLIPWPWFSPWIAPALIAALFVGWGGWTLAAAERTFRLRAADVTLFVVGALLALAAFLLPAAPLLAGGTEAFRGWTPGSFSWWLYVPGLALMAASLLRVCRTRQA